jgi:hypothetical protein
VKKQKKSSVHWLPEQLEAAIPPRKLEVQDHEHNNSQNVQ